MFFKKKKKEDFVVRLDYETRRRPIKEGFYVHGEYKLVPKYYNSEKHNYQRLATYEEIEEIREKLNVLIEHLGLVYQPEAVTTEVLEAGYSKVTNKK